MSPTPPDADNLINVSALNQFAYCQRRYWYYNVPPAVPTSVGRVRFETVSGTAHGNRVVTSIPAVGME